MKEIIREGVFETNSSAVHTLAISHEGLEPSYLPVDEDGYIITDFGNFGEYDMAETVWDQQRKLSYLATECFYLNGWDTHIEDSPTWQRVCNAVSKYAGARGIKVLKVFDPELNHQVIPEWSLKFCNDYDDLSIINFVFNKYIGIKMSHD